MGKILLPLITMIGIALVIVLLMPIFDKLFKAIGKWLKQFGLAALCLITLAGCYQVDDTEICVKRVWGKYQEQIVSTGVETYNPVSTDLICVDKRIQKHNGQLESYTKDLQTAKIKFFVNWKADAENAVALNKILGTNYATRLESETESAIKAIVGQYDSENLIAKRPEVELAIVKLLNQRLSELYMNAESVRIEDISYSDQYAAAIEAKQIAEQDAKKEKNLTLQKEEEAKQAIVMAKADAEAMRIKTNALATSKSLIDYERVQALKIQAEKWDGILPTHIYGAAPLPIVNIQ